MKMVTAVEKSSSDRAEVTTPLLVDPSDHRNVTDLLVSRLRDTPDHIAFEVPTENPLLWKQVSIKEFADEVFALAKGIIASGIQPGQTVAIMSPTSYHWTLFDMAAFFAGAVIVPIYETSSASQTASILKDAEVGLVFVGGVLQQKTVEEAIALLRVNSISVWSVSDLVVAHETGKEISDQFLEERRTMADLDSVATIVYTSGTGGESKGALITHRNLVGQILNISGRYTDVVNPAGNTVIFLPLAHVLARGLQMICLAGGMRIAHVADPKETVASLSVLRPTFLVVVPRVLERIRTAVEESARAKHLGWLWESACSAAIDRARRGEQEDPHFPRSLRLKHAFFDRLFFRRIRKLLGGRIECLLSGAAYLDPDLALLFTGMGVPIIEGYGLTETTAPLTGNTPTSLRSGTVGSPQPGNTVRIAGNGEVLAKGIGVFKGYRNPALDREAFVDDYFRTGDLGRLDSEGRLYLTGRVKDVVTTSSGKTISPERWERMIEGDPLVAHAIIVGEGRPYLNAFIVLDQEVLTAWMNEEGLTESVSLSVCEEGLRLVDNDAILARISRLVEAANHEVSRPEQIRRFQILIGNLNPGSQLATPTMKLRRQSFLAAVGTLVAGLYAESTSV